MLLPIQDEPNLGLITMPPNKGITYYVPPAGVKWPAVCEKCGHGEPVKTDGEGRAVCSRCAVCKSQTIVVTKRQSRNNKCACKSGKKYKDCCRKPKK